MIIESKPIIICIVGPSGSGKTTMARFLEKALDIPMLVSYTTRPKRPNEIDGVDHRFVTEDQMPSRDKMLAYTKFGNYHYWMPLEEVEDKGICTYVIDEKGLLELAENFSDGYNLFSILVKRDTDKLIAQVGKERVKRDLERVSIPEAEYCTVIANNDRIEDFLADSYKLIKNFLE